MRESSKNLSKEKFSSLKNKMVKELKAKEEIVSNPYKEKVSPFSKITKGENGRNTWMEIERSGKFYN